ncbi:MAG TPA: nitrilase-related carbon-nitrogen hydrolase, partial [Povalibacter sp.]
AIDALTATAVRDENSAHAVAEEYAALVRKLAAVNPQPQFIVLPEKVFADRVGWSGRSLQVLQETADETDVTLVAGFDEDLDAQRRGNTARVLLPRLPTKVYLKRRMVPGLEEHFTGGAESLVDHGYGVAICKDLDFPGLIREYGAAQTRLLLVPAWDFVGDGRLHARMAVVRGVENGFALARAAAMGRLTVSDAFGRIVAERVTDPSSASTLSATVGLVSGRTLYSRTGNALAWLVVAAAVAIVAWATLGLVQRPPRKESSRRAGREPGAVSARRRTAAMRPRKNLPSKSGSASSA